MVEIRPSSLPYSALCHGRARFIEGMESTAGAAAAKGTAMHMVAAGCLVMDTDPADLLGVEVEGYEQTQEMVDIVTSYVQQVRDLAGPNTEMWIEQAVPVGPWTMDGKKGTIDALIWDKVANSIIIIDLKTGRNPVAPDEQLECYALGADLAADELGIEVDLETTFQLTIIQPPLGVAESVFYSLDQMGDINLKLHKLAADIQDPASPLTPGDKQCRYCPGKAVCPAIREASDNVVRFSSPGFTGEAPKLSPTDIAEILPHTKAIKSWCDALEAESLNLLNAGATVPGYKLVKGQKGRRSWADPDAALGMMHKSMKIPLKNCTVPKVMSPTQAEKMLSPRRWLRMLDLVTQPEGKPIVVPEDDKRDAIVTQPFEVLD